MLLFQVKEKIMKKNKIEYVSKSALLQLRPSFIDGIGSSHKTRNAVVSS